MALVFDLFNIAGRKVNDIGHSYASRTALAVMGGNCHGGFSKTAVSTRWCPDRSVSVPV